MSRTPNRAWRPADPIVPAAAVEAFRVPLDAAGATLDVVTYPGVAHSLTSPDADKVGNAGLKYDETTAADLLRRIQELFTATLGKSWQTPRPNLGVCDQAS